MTLTLLLRFIDNIFRRPIRYLLPIALLGFIGYGTASTIDFYRSTGTVAVSETTFLASLTEARGDERFLFNTASEVAANEIQGLLATETFTTDVLNAANDDPEGGPYASETLDALRNSISLSPTSDIFLQISSRTTTPEASQSLVNAVISSFVQWQIDADIAQSNIAEQFFRDLSASLALDVDAARARLELFLLENPDPVTGDRPTTEVFELSELQAEVDSATARYETALDNQRQAELATIQTETDIRQGFVTVDTANLPVEPESRLTSLLIRIILFGIIGVAISVAVALITTVVDTSVRFPAEIRERLGMDILAVVPKTK